MLVSPPFFKDPYLYPREIQAGAHTQMGLYKYSKEQQYLEQKENLKTVISVFNTMLNFSH